LSTDIRQISGWFEVRITPLNAFSNLKLHPAPIAEFTGYQEPRVRN
jgi:hypothetical protein